MKSRSLQRQLRFWDSVAINVGIVIGVGIFRVPSEAAKYIDSSPMILLAWVLGGAVALLGVLCYGELSSRFPETGGTYIYLREAYGKFTAFLFGWTEFAILRSASIAAVAYIFADYLQNFIPMGSAGEKLTAVLTIAVFTAVNIAGLQFGAGVQKVLSFLKVFTILAIAGLIFWFARFQAGTWDNDIPSQRTFVGLAAYLPAMIPILWSYGGWHESTFMSGEFRDTRKELPVSLIVGSLIVTGLYVFINAAYLKVMSPNEMIHSHAIASDSLTKLFGLAGQMAVTAAVLISACGALNSQILTGARIPFAVAQDCPRFAWFGKVSPRYGTPLRALLLNSLWAVILALWGSFERLLFFSGFANWLFFVLAGASVFLVRKRPSAADSFSMMGYPFVPALFILCAASLCLTTIVHTPREALVGALLISAGAPLYFILRGRGLEPPGK